MRRVAGGLCVLSAGISGGLWLIGAWPVIGFTGLEALLAVWLMNRHARATGASERLLLSEEGLRVVRTDGRGRHWERRLQGAWLRASLHERPGRTPALLLHDRRARIEVGAELGEAEKRDLAAALREALHRQRHPLFDNPQLRDGAD